MRAPFLPATAAAALAWAIPAPGIARAGAGGNIDLNAFHHAVDSRGFITANASDVLAHRELSFGLVTSWGHGVLSLAGDGATYEVEHVISPTLQAAFGLQLGLGLELGVSLPFHIVSGDVGPDTDGGTPGDPNDDEDFGFDAQGMGDVGAHLKVRLVDGAVHALGVALLASVYFPGGHDEAAWLGEDGVSFVPWLIVDGDLGRRLRVGANVGLRIRTGDPSFTDDGQRGRGLPLAPATRARVAAGSEIPFAAAVSYAIVPERVDLVGEVFGGIPLGGEGYQPLEALGGLKLYLARSSFFLLGGGVGLVPGAAGGANPDVRAFIGIVFEPSVGDRDGDGDGDGRKDDVDRCLDDAEDSDGFEDADGCPEPDNDGDRILDVDDGCPNEPETPNGYQDTDGCPDRTIATRTSSGIDLAETIYFETDRAVIKPVSFPTLDAVAATMKANPDIRVLEIQGHTDERNTRAYNLALSQARAEAVKSYLVGQGVDAERLAARGYGEEDPVDPGHDAAAWARNRRVDFVILEPAP